MRNRLSRIKENRFGTAVAAALAVSIITLLVGYVLEFEEASRFVHSQALERQIEYRLSPRDESLHQAILNVLGEREDPTDRERRRICKEALKELVGATGNRIASMSPALRDAILSIPECDFREPTLQEHFDASEPLLLGAVAFLLTFACVASWHWVLTWPHRGWRRLSVVLALLSGAAFVGYQIMEDDLSEEGLLGSLVAATVVPLCVLAAVNTVKWIKRGFENPSGET